MKDYNKLTKEQQAQVDKLIASFKPEFDWEEFYPEVGETYCYIGAFETELIYTTWNNSVDDKIRFKQGDYSLTEKEANKKTKRRRAITKWELIAKKLNGDWKENEHYLKQDIYFPSYDLSAKELYVSSSFQYKRFPYASVKSEELCQQAMDIILAGKNGKEDMKLLLGVE